MNAALLLLLGLVIGIVVGWLLQRLDVQPVVRSIFAMELSWMFAVVAGGLIWMMLQASSREGIVAISFGLTEIMLTLLTVAFVAAGIPRIAGSRRNSESG